MSEETQKTVDQPPEPEINADESANEEQESPTEKIAAEIFKAIVSWGLLVFFHFLFRTPFTVMFMGYLVYRCFKKNRPFALYTLGASIVVLVFIIVVDDNIEKAYLQQGDAIIEKVEEYKAKHGNYPENLSVIGDELKIEAERKKKFNYSIREENNGYRLSIFFTTGVYSYYSQEPGAATKWHFRDFRFPLD